MKAILSPCQAFFHTEPIGGALLRLFSVSSVISVV